MQEEISQTMEIGLVVAMTAALVSVILTMSILFESVLYNKSNRYISISNTSAISDIVALKNGPKSVAEIYKVVCMHPDRINSLLVDNEFKEDASARYNVYKLISTELIDNATTQGIVDDLGIADSFPNIDNVYSSDDIYNTDDDLLSIKEGCGYTEYDVEVFRCKDNGTWDIVAKAVEPTDILRRELPTLSPSPLPSAEP